MPLETFDTFFQERFTQEAVKLYQIKLLVYDPLKAAIVAWKD
ncbi:element excision factor XisH family protein [Microseira sp. BLCC-F43]